MNACPKFEMTVVYCNTISLSCHESCYEYHVMNTEQTRKNIFKLSIVLVL